MEPETPPSLRASLRFFKYISSEDMDHIAEVGRDRRLSSGRNKRSIVLSRPPQTSWLERVASWFGFTSSSPTQQQPNKKQKQQHASGQLELHTSSTDITTTIPKPDEARQFEPAQSEAQNAEEARRAEEAIKAEEARNAEEAIKAEEARRAEEARAEEARRVEEARKAEEARNAEEARKADEQAQQQNQFPDTEKHAQTTDDNSTQTTEPQDETTAPPKTTTPPETTTTCDNSTTTNNDTENGFQQTKEADLQAPTMFRSLRPIRGGKGAPLGDLSQANAADLAALQKHLGNFDMGRFMGGGSARATSGEQESPRIALPTPRHNRQNSHLVGAIGCFGMPIHLLLCTEDKVPLFFLAVMKYLYAKRAYAEEGIFRVAGATNQIKELKQQCNKAGSNFSFLDQVADMNAVTSLLKHWLMEMPDPIVPTQTFRNLVAAYKQSEDEDVRVAKFAGEIALLPQQNKAVLKHLLFFAVVVSKHQDENRMDITNVGNVLAPTVMRTRDELEYISNFGVAGGCVIFILRHYTEIFGRYEPMEFMNEHLREEDFD